MLVAEAGVAVNPRRKELARQLAHAGLGVRPIEALRQATGAARSQTAEIDDGRRIVAVVQSRDGNVIDVVRQAA